MIKLYGIPGACSLAPHIILEELKLPYELKLFTWTDRETRSEMKKLNPMGQVPTLVTEEGYPLAEGAAIMQYLISKKPTRLFPESGKERFKAFEWMNFISTALHKAFIPLFNPKVFSDDETHFEAIKRVGAERLKKLLEVTQGRFSDGDYALGNDFTVIDAYLFTVLNWCRHFKISLAPYPKLNAFMKKVAPRPSVVAAMKQEE